MKKCLFFPLGEIPPKEKKHNSSTSCKNKKNTDLLKGKHSVLRGAAHSASSMWFNSSNCPVRRTQFLVVGERFAEALCTHLGLRITKPFQMQYTALPSFWRRPFRQGNFKKDTVVSAFKSHVQGEWPKNWLFHCCSFLLLLKLSVFIISINGIITHFFKIKANGIIWKIE